MTKPSKVKGYGAYWKGDIKNKTIARRNKQYISDQRCLRVYKKQLQRDAEQLEAPNDSTGGDVKLNRGGVASTKTFRTSTDQDVTVIKPQVEIVYYMPESSRNGEMNYVNEGGPDESPDDSDNDVVETDEASIADGTDEEDGSDYSEIGNPHQDHDDGMLDEANSEYKSTNGIEPSQSTRIHSSPTSKRANSPQGDSKSNFKVDHRTRKGSAKAESGSALGERPKGKGEKFSGVYAKALKIRHERSKIRQQQYEEKLSKTIQKKREIREKKQQRYARHRLLGNKTKKGQPIMANVISHLMNNFQKKHKLDD
ncbi:hypothetical protein X943_000640 [Babesia divergens]|uniref:rRNA-processing protein FYV7 n=1 Tax=Babesia divergens TaxID=32595 RepID=A0AAD9LEK1_BABDI|nr:hypothetical protein X943_000640 [Babesia divergens]